MDAEVKARVVQFILDGAAEEALVFLAGEYGVDVPRLRVGLPKGRKRNLLGCYSARDKTISVLNSDALKQPFVILHEFYHHLRTRVDLKHRGTEKNANEFANSFLQAYELIAMDPRRK
ncbi:hypothetical protein KEJ15_07390 [Candidatus Bathyarchaeota archaeon]|nr:hypothetical protein [Candidatus Bathyarchaeota archaeon]